MFSNGMKSESVVSFLRERRKSSYKKTRTSKSAAELFTLSDALLTRGLSAPLLSLCIRCALHVSVIINPDNKTGARHCGEVFFKGFRRHLLYRLSHKSNLKPCFFRYKLCYLPFLIWRSEAFEASPRIIEVVLTAFRLFL